MDRFFSLVGKLLIGTILLLLVLSVGYFVGTSKNTTETQKTETATPTASLQIDTAKNQPTILPQETPTPSPIVLKKIVGGTADKDATSFTTYSLLLPKDWIDKKENTPNLIDTLILTKDTYSIKISQAPMGGGGCLYEGDAEQIMATPYKNFVTLQTADTTFRRSWDDTKDTTITYTICEKGKTGSYGNPTKYGAITVTAPNPSDEMMLKEVDTILSTITKE